MKESVLLLFVLLHANFSLHTAYDESCVDPKAKCVIMAMDLVFMDLDPAAWENKRSWLIVLSEFYTDDMIYDTNYTPNQDLNNSTDLGMWIDKEVIPYFVAFGNVTFNQSSLVRMRPPLPQCMQRPLGGVILEQCQGPRSLDRRQLTGVMTFML